MTTSRTTVQVAGVSCGIATIPADRLAARGRGEDGRARVGALVRGGDLIVAAGATVDAARDLGERVTFPNPDRLRSSLDLERAREAPRNALGRKGRPVRRHAGLPSAWEGRPGRRRTPSAAPASDPHRGRDA